MVINMTIGTKENALKKTAVTGKVFLILTILIMSLTACGGSTAQDMPDAGTGEETISMPNAETGEETASMSNAETEETTVSIPETYEEYITFAADSYRQQDWENALAFYENAKKLDESREEVYRGMSDVYLQMDEVMQALAVLDEGMEKCGDNHSVDSLSQRKEYVLAGMVAVRTEETINKYDEDGNIFPSSVSEYDENGNEIKAVDYTKEGEIDNIRELQYDKNSRRTAYKSINYNDDGSFGWFFHETWAYDADGNEIEYVSYDENGNIEKRKENEYDTNGNQIKHTEYDEKGKIAIQTETIYNAEGKKIKYEEYNEDRRVEKKIIRDYDADGNQTKYVRYDTNGNTIEKWECTYDENGNEIKYVHYSDAVTVDYWYEKEYDGHGNGIKFVRYDDDGISSMWERKYEYDERGNEIKYVCYDDGSISFMWEKEYDECGNAIKYVGYDGDGSINYMWERTYDENGNETYVSTADSGGINCTREYEYEYDENKNITKYACINYEREKKTDSLRWEREYDEAGRETAFYFYDNYDNEKTVSYQSKTEYNEIGLVIKYTGYDKNGNRLVVAETEYDASGNVLRESNYDAGGNPVCSYENEYDEFGSITRQSVYKDGVLQYECQISYAYRYIGNIDAEAADYMDNDVAPEEYNLKQREAFTRFLEGQGKVRYYNDIGAIQGGKIVWETITDLIDFAYYGKYKESLEYTFLDMTGDGIEELIIRGSGTKIYVIQCDYGILKVIHDDVGGNLGSYLVKYNGSIGVCHDFGGHVGANEQYYHFFDGKGKAQMELCDYQDFLEDGTESRAYSTYDYDSYICRDISKGEYYDIKDMMITNIDVDWNELEEPSYGND